ncbi:hypothetical protein [Halochromatium sp.]
MPVPRAPAASQRPSRHEIDRSLSGWPAAGGGALVSTGAKIVARPLARTALEGRCRLAAATDLLLTALCGGSARSSIMRDARIDSVCAVDRGGIDTGWDEQLTTHCDIADPGALNADL